MRCTDALMALGLLTTSTTLAQEPTTLSSPTMPETATPPAPTPPATATPPTPIPPSTATPETPAPLAAQPLTVPPEQLTQTDTTPMPVVIEPPSWRLRLGVDVGGGLLFPGPGAGGALAARIGAQRGKLGLLVELGLLGAAGGVTGEDGDGNHMASGGSVLLASATPMVQYDVGPGGFVGLGVVLGSGSFASTEDRVDGDDVIERSSKSAGFVPGLDARVGWRFGAAHTFTITAGAKVLATSVRTDTVTVPATSAPTSTSDTGFGAAVVPTLSIGYDFR